MNNQVYYDSINFRLDKVEDIVMWLFFLKPNNFRQKALYVDLKTTNCPKRLIFSPFLSKGFEDCLFIRAKSIKAWCFKWKMRCKQKSNKTMKN